MNVTNITTHVVDAPAIAAAPPSAEITVAVTAAKRTVARCGPWPTTGTLARYELAVNRAHCEWLRTIEIADRYWRRFRHPINDPASTRLMMRREALWALFEQRQECLRLLTGPEAGAV
jgi:hypothetical protein